MGEGRNGDDADSHVWREDADGVLKSRDSKTDERDESLIIKVLL